MAYSIYVVLCRDNVTYTGITEDLERRISSHKDGYGCKVTKRYGFIAYHVTARADDHLEAVRLEKHWTRLMAEHGYTSYGGGYSAHPLHPTKYL